MMTVQDYYTGGELTKLIYKYGGLPASKAKNLAAQLVCVSLTASTRNPLTDSYIRRFLLLRSCTSSASSTVTSSRATCSSAATATSSLATSGFPARSA